ncbi:MAG: ATP synthase F1 subunit epsilon [Oscillospiraceae bacterium]|jgi:F-type H+-transporting ATPase subunit epsilon|nr:ATP synthase F1 subunit epsilon [Oscillospiraceae bacterium]
MPTPFQLDILTPEHSFFSGKAEGVVVITPDGEIGVQAHHAPLVTPVEIGTIRLLVDGQWKEAFISEGFMEVQHDRTVIFTQACEWPENIDVLRAEATMQRSQEQLRQQLSIREHKTSQIALARAMARLRVTREQNLHLK